jgi:DNA-binding MarR family transcriptional regulator
MRRARTLAYGKALIDPAGQLLQSRGSAGAMSAIGSIGGSSMTANIDFELRLGFLVHDVSRLRRNVIDRVLKPLGVTRSQWWVLAFLSREDGMSQVALADELDLGKVALGGLIDRLEATGLVERRPDKKDRRIKRVFLARKGINLIGEIRESVADVEKLLMAGIKGSDVESTVRALRTMKANLLGLLSTEPDEEEGVELKSVRRGK